MTVHSVSRLAKYSGRVSRRFSLVRLPITRTIKAPGFVQLDERRISVIAPRFDGFVAFNRGSDQRIAHQKG